MKKQIAIFATAVVGVFGAVSVTAQDLPDYCYRTSDGRVHCQLCPVGGCGGSRTGPVGLSEIVIPVR